jgi:hypothetical protein
MTAAYADRCYRIDDAVPHLKRSYRKLLFVPGQTPRCDLADTDAETLIVSSDWLFWQKLIGAGRHAVYYEQGLTDYDPGDVISNDTVVISNDWVYRNGEDITEFMGVSLGKQFSTNMTLFIASVTKLKSAIERLVDRYSPQEIAFIDCRLERFNPGRHLRVQIASDIAAARGLRFSDIATAAQSGAGERQEASEQSPWERRPERKSLRAGLIQTFVTLLDGASRFRHRILPRRLTVLVWLGQNLSVPLIEGFSGQDIYPVFSARWMPKTRQLIGHCFRRGVLLAALPSPRLTRQEKEQVDRIRETLQFAAGTEHDGLSKYIWDHVVRYVVNTGFLEETARNVKGAQRLLSRYRPGRLVVDGVKNPPGRILMELANLSGISVDYIWHAPMAPHNIRFDALGCTPPANALVSRCLSWGQANDDWLKQIGSTVLATRVGNPILRRYTHRANVDGTAAQKNVLLLQYSAIHVDIKTLNAVQYAYFVDAVRMLNARGHTNVRMKLHPGLWRVAYFEEIARTFGLNCTVHKDEPFQQMVEWADIAIGPVYSGAMMEVLAAGKDYYAMLIPPTSLDASYLEFANLSQDVESLGRALRARSAIEGTDVLNYFCDLQGSPDPVGLFWAAIRQPPEISTPHGRKDEIRAA